MYQPRYSKEHREQAKASGGMLYTLDIDRRFTLDNDRGGRITSQGVAKPVIEEALLFAYYVMNGYLPVEARRIAKKRIAEITVQSERRKAAEKVA